MCHRMRPAVTGWFAYYIYIEPSADKANNFIQHLQYLAEMSGTTIDKILIDEFVLSHINFFYIDTCAA